MSSPPPAAPSASVPPASALRPGSRRKAARGPNPLLVQADALLALAPELRATSSVADMARLRARIVEMLRDFELRSRVHGVGAARIARAQAALGALIDDVVDSMPWGADAGWQPLALATAAKAGLAAQSPVRRLAGVAAEASGDHDLQELLCVALCLGFDGGARDAAAGADALAQVRNQLSAQLRADGPGTGRALSPQWRPAVGRAGALASWLPLWVASLLAAALLAGLYFSLALSLGARSDRVYAQIASLRPADVAPAQPVPAPLPRLAAALSAPSAARRLAVRDEIDRSVVVVPEQGLFEAGTATLLAAGIETLRPVAAALQATPGPIQVIGHTDGRAARSARYPSDWDLSVDRARSVHDALRALGIAGSRLSFDGRADTEPVAAGGGAGGRVEIVLLAGR